MVRLTMRGRDKWQQALQERAFTASNGGNGGLAFMNGANEVTRGQAITDQTRLDTGLPQRCSQRVVGDAWRRPQK